MNLRYSCDIGTGKGVQYFATIAEIQSAVRDHISGVVPSSQWFAHLHRYNRLGFAGSKIWTTDADRPSQRPKVTHQVSYNGRIWDATGKVEVQIESMNTGADPA